MRLLGIFSVLILFSGCAMASAKPIGGGTCPRYSIRAVAHSEPTATFNEKASQVCPEGYKVININETEQHESRGIIECECGNK